jgi:dihydrofolate reductase
MAGEGRKIILSMFVSVDGYISGQNGEFDWFVWDKEMENYSVDLVKTVDTMLFGRKTYQLMESYWPNASPPEESPIIIDAMNNTPKVVFSRTLEKAGWNNSRLVEENAKEEVVRLKQQPGKNIVIYGSSEFAAYLTGQSLIDEYQMIINPVILGEGKRLFEGIDQKTKMELKETRKFKSGNVLLNYRKK